MFEKHGTISGKIPQIRHEVYVRISFTCYLNIVSKIEKVIPHNYRSFNKIMGYNRKYFANNKMSNYKINTIVVKLTVI